MLSEKILAYLRDAGKPLTTGDIARSIHGDFHEVRKTLRVLHKHGRIDRIMSNGKPFNTHKMAHGIRYTKPKDLTLEIHWLSEGG